MKNGSTLLLRGVILFFGLVVLLLYIFVLPWFFGVIVKIAPEAMLLRYISIVCWYATSIPLFYALHQTFRLLSLIDKNMAFSESSVAVLRSIKRCAVFMSILLVCGLPSVYFLAQADDAPGLMLIGLIIACVPFSIAIFASVLQKVLHQAIAIKTENDSTI